MTHCTHHRSSSFKNSISYRLFIKCPQILTASTTSACNYDIHTKSVCIPDTCRYLTGCHCSLHQHIYDSDLYSLPSFAGNFEHILKCCTICCCYYGYLFGKFWQRLFVFCFEVSLFVKFGFELFKSHSQSTLAIWLYMSSDKLILSSWSIDTHRALYDYMLSFDKLKLHLGYRRTPHYTLDTALIILDREV